MAHAKHALLILACSVFAGCGGGGGGDDGGGSTPPGGGPARLQADLKGANASVFAEVFREFLLSEIATLDAAVSAFGGDMPLLDLNNIQDTVPCDQSGQFTVTIAGNGAELTFQYESCVEAGLTTDGRVAVRFTNVNQTARTFDYELTYTAFSLRAGSFSQTLNGTTRISTSVGNGVHTHSLVLNRTIDNGASVPTFTAENLAVTLRHSRDDFGGITVTAAGGSIGTSDRGFAALVFRSANNDVRFSGGGGSELFITLDGVSYRMRYQDAQGRNREVSVTASQSNQLMVLDGRNDAPRIEFVPDVTLNDGGVFLLDLRQAVFDPDFEAIDVSVALVSGPAGHTLAVADVAALRYRLAAAGSGVYTLRITVTDAAGLEAQRAFTVTVIGDYDRDGLRDDVDADDDNDGVADVMDAFPFDPAETHDADGDAIGDVGDTDDDNDGVGDVHDAFPLDPACSAPSDGIGQRCFLTSIRGYGALLVANDVLHFVDMGEEMVYRWDANAGKFIDTWQLGTAVPSSNQMTSAAWVAAHGRFYFGYNSGAITSVAPQLGTEQSFASAARDVRGLAAAGNFLFASDIWAMNYTFAADASLSWSEGGHYASSVYTFNPAESRVYFFRDGTSPNDLHYEEIDQTTGARVSAGESPYHGDYGIEPPIVVSPSGNLILIGSGNLFNAGSLTWAGAVPGGIRAAHWDAADGLVMLRTAGDATTVLERRDAALGIVERRQFEGTARGIARLSHGYVIVTETPSQLLLHEYHASDDTDGDGVLNTSDAFPLDVAASIDTDRDGYPDSWNGGRSQADSTTGLVLDAYPTESACYLPEHGDGVTCNIASTLPNYYPDAVAGDVDGIVYLLSSVNNRVYRYSGPAAAHLSPIVVGDDAPLNATAPSLMEYAPEHQRLYFGYDSGAVTYVDLGDPQRRERPFVNVATAVGGLGAAGAYLAVQDYSGAWATHYYFDEAASLRDSAEWNYYSRDYEWNATLRRLFFFRHSQSPSDVHYEQIGADGTIEGAGETPYHGDYSYREPIVMSPDDQYVLTGSGDIFRASDLTWYRKLPSGFVAAVWDDNGTITALEDAGSTTRVHRYDANQVWQSEQSRFGAPLALLEQPSGYLLVTHDGGKPAFALVAR